MPEDVARFGSRLCAAAAAAGTARHVRFSTGGFIAATLIQTAAIPAAAFAASAWAGAPVHLMLGGNPGDSAGMIFLAQWWYVALIFAGPLAMAGLLQRPLMNRMGWTGLWAFALPGTLFGTAWSFFAFHAGIYGVRDGWPLTAQLLFVACLAPFALAHALVYRALGGVGARA